MARPLRVLFVEDNPADAELLARELRRAGYAPDWQRADTEAEFSGHLDASLDLILSDYEMPQFSGLRALEVLKASGLEIPFIIVSGTIGEETAVAVMREGAADYLIKDRLGRLGPAVHRALDQSRLLRERHHAERVRRHAEEALRLFRTLVDQSNDTFQIIDPATGRFLDVNERGCNDLGYTREEHLALRVPDIDPEIGAEAWPEFVARLREAGSLRREGTHRRKDGSVFPIGQSARWVHHDRNYIVSVVRDITDRKRSEQRFRRLVESNAQGVMFWQSSGGITGANDAFLTMVGRTRAELEAGELRWDTVTPPEFRESDRFAVEEIAARGVCTPYEKDFQQPGGERVSVLVGAAAFEDTPDEGVCFVLDLTERKKLEQQFLRAQRMESIGTLAGGIAHDLNNVLAPIIMSLDLMKMKFTDAASREMLEVVSSSAQRGADMVRQVLSFARGVDGRRMEIQIKHLIDDIEKIANETFLKHIQVKTVVPSRLWTTTGDPTQLHQVLLNLCVNARDAMPGGGTLTLSAENVTLDEHYVGMNLEAKPGPHVLIQVEDTGTGMAPAIVDKIFDPFFTTKEVGKGTGLGLSTSLAIVKSHGGFMRVHSTPGVGTSFKIFLPAWTGPVSEEIREISHDLPRGNGELILVADDEMSVREVTRRTLESFGYRVLLAFDGADAVAIYATRQAEIAVVLTDMTMPVMDGAAAIQVLKKFNPRLRIIAASGLSSNSYVAEAASFGVKHFLAKPYTAEALLNSLREVLRDPA